MIRHDTRGMMKNGGGADYRCVMANAGITASNSATIDDSSQQCDDGQYSAATGFAMQIRRHSETTMLLL
jgi:hypothetical protein